MSSTIQADVLFYFLIPTVIVAIIGGYVSWSGLTKYYSMKQAVWSPPGFVFSIVWLAFYVLTIIAGYQYYTRQPDNTKKVNYLNAYYISLLFNFSWIFAFFGNPSVFSAQLALMILLFYFLVVIWLAYEANTVSNFSMWVFIVLATWLVFAATLNLAFINLNYPDPRAVRVTSNSSSS